MDCDIKRIAYGGAAPSFKQLWTNVRNVIARRTPATDGKTPVGVIARAQGCIHPVVFAGATKEVFKTTIVSCATIQYLILTNVRMGFISAGKRTR
jgi:hypothetical protein